MNNTLENRCPPGHLVAMPKRQRSETALSLVYDLDPASATYHQAVAEYVHVLPLSAAEANNRHTPVSEILALSDTKYLILQRDSRGLGGDAGTFLYKRIVEVDASKASNILGTGYDLEKQAPGQISLPRAGLPSNVVAVASRDLVDLLNASQLAKYGLNLAPSNQNINTLSEKWEALAVIALNDPAAPNDYLLLVGNDNDFRAPVVYHNGVAVGTNAIFSDNMLLAFRVGEDHLAPTVACPPDPVRVAAAAGCSLPNVTSFAVAQDNSAAPIKVTQDPVAGTAVPLETPVPITIKATDAAGNVSEPCTLTVVVFDGPPSIRCPGTVTLDVGADCLATLPNLLTNVVASDNCGPVTLAQEPPAGTLLGTGTYSVTVTATDATGQTASCVTSVRVVDRIPPTIVGVVPSLTTLWPPSQKMVPITVSVGASDNCGPVTCAIVEVTSSEPVTGLDDPTSPDWQITGLLSVELRAERADTGTGRIYTLTVKCTDAAGNSTTRKAMVTVPHDQRRPSRAEL